jgi:predicted PilT family ATPase
MIALIEAAKNVGMKNTSSYFTDVDFDIFKAQVDEAIQRAIDSGKTIVIPADGIGTGKAELEKRAPKLFAYLQQRLDELKSLNSTSPVQLSLNFGENKSPINESANSTTETKPVIKLTKEQESVVNGVVSHIENSIEPILINGKAGTGKTFIVNEILRKLPSIKHV